MITAETEELVQWLKNQYRDAKVLPDGSIACLCDLLYTRAIMLGCDRYGFERRFCFEDRKLANRRYEELQSENDIPQGFTASRMR